MDYSLGFGFWILKWTQINIIILNIMMANILINNLIIKTTQWKSSQRNLSYRHRKMHNAEIEEYNCFDAICWSFKWVWNQVQTIWRAWWPCMAYSVCFRSLVSFDPLLQGTHITNTNICTLCMYPGYSVCFAS